MLELARESDWEAVRRLSVQIHNLHALWRPDIYYSYDEPYLKTSFLEDIQKRLVYVAKVNSQILGYVILSVQQKGGPGIHLKKLLRLDRICVDETHRGRGIGKAMIRDVCALARAFDCTEVILGVHPENEYAVEFYQKCGFRIRTLNLDLNV